MSSGIQSVRRIEAVDLDGRAVGIVIGHTDRGDIALGVASAKGDEIVLLSKDAAAAVIKELRQATIRATTGDAE